MYVARDKLPVICRLERTYKNIVLHYKGCTTSMHYELGSRSMHYEFGWFINECKPVLGQRPSPRRLPLPERLPGRQRTDMVGRETAQGKRPVVCCLGPAKNCTGLNKMVTDDDMGLEHDIGLFLVGRSVHRWNCCHHPDRDLLDITVWYWALREQPRITQDKVDECSEPPIAK